MRTMIAIAIFAIGCKQKPADDTGATPGQSGAMSKAGSMGSSMGTVPPKTPDEIAKQFTDSIAGRFDGQLVMISGTTVIAIVREISTGKFSARIVEMDSAGVVTSDKTYEPNGPIAEFPTKLALISKNDEGERANLSLFKGKTWAAGEFVAVLSDGLTIHYLTGGKPAQTWAFKK